MVQNGLSYNSLLRYFLRCIDQYMVQKARAFIHDSSRFLDNFITMLFNDVDKS